MLNKSVAVDELDNPLYVVENGREYRLMTLRQRRKLFESENGEKSASPVAENQKVTEKKFPILAEAEVKAKRKEPPTETKCEELTREKTSTGSSPCPEVPNNLTEQERVKSLNVPYIVEEQDILRNINIVKSVKNLFSKQSNATKTKSQS